MVACLGKPISQSCHPSPTQRHAPFYSYLQFEGCSSSRCKQRGTLCISFCFQLTAQDVWVHAQIFLREKQNFPSTLFVIPKENQDAAESMQWHQLSVLSPLTVWQFLILNLQLPEPRHRAKKNHRKTMWVSLSFHRGEHFLNCDHVTPSRLCEVMTTNCGPFHFFSKNAHVILEPILWFLEAFHLWFLNAQGWQCWPYPMV